MEQEAKFEGRRPEIICNLPHCALVKDAGGFCLNNQFVVDNYVEPLTRDFFPLV